MTRYRYVTFDCYGTLIDWKMGIENALGEAFGKGQIDRLMQAYLKAEQEEEREYRPYREVLKMSALRAAKDLGADLAPERASEFAESLHRWPAFSDTVESLGRLRERGYSLYILSNVDTDQLSRTIENNELEVDGFVTAESVRSYKPSPAHWEAFARRTGPKKEEVLHVAQSVYHDIVPAKRMGLATAWVNRYGESPTLGAEATYVVNSLNELAKVLP